ncbi:Pimeloyl-ACP methyl ester carboxylesterase [Catalinimonas alkaloidigena]|uniref:Pimeloyl-ACP methyl ester carboxylesterase n=1 Tax=Catalinimonas alkaloidigena TaxID=1075417 RepID=A0A1G9MNH9_9BACT|nr:alpha/beta fold hydrolase [Catalinimonas alkaloidigena]SDL75215.1 Pimeloyl-ACP methyl ester carboxylesterase [Catalinimonas alkaloidigena]
MQLAYKLSGEEQPGRPVVILHGLLGSADNWLSQSKQLATERPVYLVDQRNHGQSPHAEAFTYQAMAADLLEFLTEHDLDRPFVVGHSMGGKTAMFFATQYPEHLQGLVVADIAPRYYPVHHQQILAGLKSIPVDSIKSRQEADKILSERIPELGVRQFLLKNLTRKSEGGFEWRMNLPVIDQKIEQVGEALPADARYEGPTLFLRGEHSDYIQPKDEAEIHRLFPKATIETVAGTGHWLHAEKPDEVIRLIQAFIDSAS